MTLSTSIKKTQKFEVKDCLNHEDEAGVSCETADPSASSS